jgi:hypothetical protein
MIAMADTELDRVRRDLETMKDAAGTELPFERKDVLRTFLSGLVAVPLAIWATLGPGTYMSLAIALTLVALVLVALPSGATCRRQRFQQPRRWRECRFEWLLPLLAAPFILFGFFWAVTNGTPPNTMVGIVLFVSGVALCFIAGFSRARRSAFGMGVGTMTCGIVMPWCSERQIGLAFALSFIVGMSAAAAIGAWQLRTNEAYHGTD